jgi:Plasma-membrane choline transporter
MIRSVRDNGDSLIACCAECLLGCIESLVEYFNKWAYIYVGLYGFSFMEAGSNVMTLFRNRGWSVIIADMMVDTVLFMVSIGVGAITALLTTAIGYLMGNRDATTLVIAAAFGFIVGYAMSSTLFSVVSSAVNTVIVCYAEAPNEFQANHPKLSDQMRTAWRQAYPNEFGY